MLHSHRIGSNNNNIRYTKFRTHYLNSLDLVPKRRKITFEFIYKDEFIFDCISHEICDFFFATTM